SIFEAKKWGLIPKRIRVLGQPLLLFNRIATDFLLEFVREENETAASVFFAADPNEAIEVFHHLCSVYASRWLEGLEVD
ncbi:hypothetical protein P4558_08855, partial [Geobacillus stearothermophilus]|nr:hypothetical protein [Geobacillus stearothermophilus]